MKWRFAHGVGNSEVIESTAIQIRYRRSKVGCQAMENSVAIAQSIGGAAVTE
jgi:hypothetical protein